jgi:hypothetical protein
LARQANMPIPAAGFGGKTPSFPAELPEGRARERRYSVGRRSDHEFQEAAGCALRARYGRRGTGASHGDDARGTGTADHRHRSGRPRSRRRPRPRAEERRTPRRRARWLGVHHRLRPLPRPTEQVPRDGVGAAHCHYTSGTRPPTSANSGCARRGAVMARSLIRSCPTSPRRSSAPRRVNFCDPDIDD